MSMLLSASVGCFCHWRTRFLRTWCYSLYTFILFPWHIFHLFFNNLISTSVQSHKTLKNRNIYNFYFLSCLETIFNPNPSIRNRVLCSGMLLYLHHRNSKIFFLPAKFDNFKDETISHYKTVSVPQSQILAGLKTLGLVGLWATFLDSFFMFWGAKRKI